MVTMSKNDIITQDNMRISKAHMYDVVALGELLIDFTTQATDPDGYPMMAAHPGGAPANFLAAIAKFGGTAALLGKVGTDTFGKLLTDTLGARRSGVLMLMVEPKGGPDGAWNHVLHALQEPFKRKSAHDVRKKDGILEK